MFKFWCELAGCLFSGDFRFFLFWEGCFVFSPPYSQIRNINKGFLHLNLLLPVNSEAYPSLYPTSSQFQRYHRRIATLMLYPWTPWYSRPLLVSAIFKNCQFGTIFLIQIDTHTHTLIDAFSGERESSLLVPHCT